MEIIQNIQHRIYEIRDARVMVDFDLADLYEVRTKVLNQAVKRNIQRFPSDFMFQLTNTEWETMRSQFVTASETIVYLKPRNQNKRNADFLPYAFTEQGVAMLSGVLNSDKAINMNIAIMRAFVEIRRALLNDMDLKKQVKEIRERLGEHDVQLNHIYDAIENLLDEKSSQRKWENRPRIGFGK